MINYVFKRYEIKYIIDNSTYEKIISEIKKHLVKSDYKDETIQSLYYDTDDYVLIRKSIEKPIFKEKLRLRSYGLHTDGKILFLEIKNSNHNLLIDFEGMYF